MYRFLRMMICVPIVARSCADEADALSAVRLDAFAPTVDAHAAALAIAAPACGPWTSEAHGSDVVWRCTLSVPRPPGPPTLHAPTDVTFPALDRVPYRTEAGLSWWVDGAVVALRVPAGVAPPTPLEVHAPGIDAERARRDPSSFVAHDGSFATAPIEDLGVRRSGVWLAPGTSATWTVRSARWFEATLRRIPGLDGEAPRSSQLRVEARVGGAWGVVEDAAASRDARPIAVALPLAADAVRLTNLGAGDQGSLFLGRPVLRSRRSTGRRVVFLFMDTVRRDALGLYGASRDTSPNLDRWADGATVFADARTVAPWTLPSSRALLSGVQPEKWDPPTSLVGRLADAGWTTATFFGNGYLSVDAPSLPWTTVGYELHAPASRIVDGVLRTLRNNDGRDVFVLAQFMDAHLPYDEPADLRGLFEGVPPFPVTDRFDRGTLFGLDEAQRRALVPWQRGRYDQGIRATDRELGRLFAALRPDDVVVVFADHGEAFGEGGLWEHGGGLTDELLSIPLIIRAPGLQPGWVASEVSLLDVAPTVADLLGLAPAITDGRSLVGLARGAPEEVRAFGGRTHVFGRTLYGPERWGAERGHERVEIEGRSAEWAEASVAAATGGRFADGWLLAADTTHRVLVGGRPHALRAPKAAVRWYPGSPRRQPLPEEIRFGPWPVAGHVYVVPDAPDATITWETPEGEVVTMGLGDPPVQASDGASTWTLGPVRALILPEEEVAATARGLEELGYATEAAATP